MGRLVKFQKLLGSEGVEAVLLLSRINRLYAAGFPSSAGAVLIHRGRGVLFVDFRYWEAARAAVSDFEVVRLSAGETLRAAVCAELKRLRIKSLGFEQSFMTVDMYEKWRESCNCEWMPVSAAIDELRAVKDDSELELMRRSQLITEQALTQTLNKFRTGMTERELSAELIYNMLLCGADNVSFDPIVVSGPKTSMPHGTPGDRPIEHGDALTIDCGCIKDGYCSDMTRSYAVGHASGDFAEIYGIVAQAQQAGMAAAHAGVIGKEIDRAARELITAAGYGSNFEHSFGHGIGLEVHEPFGAGMQEERRLPENCVISAEPGIYLPGRFGVRIEDVIVLKNDGFVNLTTMPKDLTVI